MKAVTEPAAPASSIRDESCRNYHRCKRVTCDKRRNRCASPKDGMGIALVCIKYHSSVAGWFLANGRSHDTRTLCHDAYSRIRRL